MSKEYHIIYTNPKESVRKEMIIQSETDEEVLEISKRGYREEKIQSGYFEIRRRTKPKTKIIK